MQPGAVTAAVVVTTDQRLDNWSLWRPLQIPTWRREGQRHVIVYVHVGPVWWQREWIAGRGPVDHVVCDSSGLPLPADFPLARRLREQPGDAPTSMPSVRVVEHKLKLPRYSRRKVSFAPNSVGYAKFCLGIEDRRIRTPEQLCDWLEGGDEALPKPLAHRIYLKLQAA